MSKPRVIVLGGVGFIGRNFVKYLVDEDLCSFIRVLDKVLPVTAFLSVEHKAAFAKDHVKFQQANLSSPASIKKNFASDEPWDIIFNLAAETKLGQTDEVYKEKVLDVAIKCSTEAEALGIPKWIEVSSSRIYSTNKVKKPAQENDPLDPWTVLAKYKRQVEEHLLNTKLNVTILRPAITYGPGDNASLCPRMVVAAVYTVLKEKMKFLWTKDLQMNTVHVDDVCAAMWFAKDLESGEAYNICDSSNTTQGSLGSMLADIFKIEVGYLGKIGSGIAKTVGLKGIAESVNEKHLKPWSDLCKEQGIVSTPLSPYIDCELLFNNGVWLDGSAIEGKGFKYSHPKLETADIVGIMEYYQKLGLFPKF